MSFFLIRIFFTEPREFVVWTYIAGQCCTVRLWQWSSSGEYDSTVFFFFTYFACLSTNTSSKSAKSHRLSHTLWKSGRTTLKLTLSALKFLESLTMKGGMSSIRCVKVFTIQLCDLIKNPFGCWFKNAFSFQSLDKSLKCSINYQYWLVHTQPPHRMDFGKLKL